MKRLGYSVVIAGLAWAAACAKDPTGVLRNGLKALSLDPDVMFINEGDNRGLNVIPRDEQLNPVAAPVTVQSINTAVATVAVDPGQASTDGSNYRFVVTAVAPGQVKLVASAGGVSDTATINVLPVSFTGVPSATTLQVGDTLTLAATTLMKFDPAKSDVQFGDTLALGEIISITAETLKVVVAQPDVSPGKLTVAQVNVTYVPGLRVDLPTSATYTITNPFGSHSNPDPAATLAIPASGAPDLVFYDGFKSTDADHYYTFTTAAIDTITFTLEWNTGADLDMYVCDAGCNNDEGGNSAANGDNPQTFSVILPAGTHNLWINVFDAADEPAHLYKITVSNP